MYFVISWGYEICHCILTSILHLILVRVHTTYLKRKFDDAQIFLEALDERCGAGTFILDDPKLFTPKGCPDIVATKTKEPMGRADVFWKAPKCGCVNIRYELFILEVNCYFDVCLSNLKLNSFSLSACVFYLSELMYCSFVLLSNV